MLMDYHTLPSGVLLSYGTQCQQQLNENTFYAVIPTAWHCNSNSVSIYCYTNWPVCCIVTMGKQIVKMFYTFSLWGSLFLMKMKWKPGRSQTGFEMNCSNLLDVSILISVEGSEYSVQFILNRQHAARPTHHFTWSNT